jgi:hypothetical protein
MDGFLGLIPADVRATGMLHSSPEVTIEARLHEFEAELVDTDTDWTRPIGDNWLWAWEWARAMERVYGVDHQAVLRVLDARYPWMRRAHIVSDMRYAECPDRRRLIWRR